MTQEHPLIGTAVWVRKDGKILLAKRAKEKSAGAGEWCPPGGHLEMYETIEECAILETREEASIEIHNIKQFLIVENTTSQNGTHYVTFHFVADWLSGDPQPQAGESEDWYWFDWGNLPSPLFRPAQQIVDRENNPLEIY